MNKYLFRLFSFLLIGTLLLSACSFNSATPSVDVQQQITQTMQAVATSAQATLQAAVPTAGVAQPSNTPVPPNTEAPTQTPVPTALPATTEPPAPSATPAASTEAPVNTPIGPATGATAHLNRGTNCRSGPSTAYSILFTGLSGADLNIVSQTSIDSYVIVENPKNTSQTCWLWTQYVDITGSLSNLPVVTPPPLPTAVVDFTVSFFRIESCSGSIPAFKVVNSGSNTLQSYTIVVKDRTSNNSQTNSSDVFDKRNGCDVVKSISFIDPGQTGFVYGDTYSYDLSGHDMKATITLCSHNGGGGKCTSQIINFTP